MLEYNDNKVKITIEERQTDKPYLVDVPVKTNIWIRKECQKLQFEVIKESRPSVLILQSDGARNKEEEKIIKYNRTYIDDNIDWNCTVIKIYSEKNLGLYNMEQIVLDYIFSVYDRCIILEDDDIPTKCFFKNCAELLELYKDDERVAGIAGNNLIHINENVNEDYFFSKYPSVHGVAYWRRSLGQMNLKDITNINENDKKRIVKICSSTEKKRVAYALKNGRERNNPLGTEFYNVFDYYLNNRLFIVFTKNQITNIGFLEGGEHFSDHLITSVAKKYLVNPPRYEYETELRHPKYMIRDEYYERKVKYILGKGHPVLNLKRKIEIQIRAIIYGDFKHIIKAVKRKITGYYEQ